MNPPQKTIFISGCSTGIGHCVAHGLAKRGYRVIATVRCENDRAALQHDNIHTLIMDVRQPQSIQNAVTEATEIAQGRIDVLFNNAGFGDDYPSSFFTAKMMHVLYI